MKNSKSVIQHLKNYPQFSKLKKYECFNKLKDVLPFKLQTGIKFIYSKYDTLFFVLTHNMYKMEFNYNLKVIIKLLKELQKIYSECSEIKNVKFFVSNKLTKEYNKPEKPTEPYYKELAKGKFEILAKDENVKKILEEIREIISKNH